MVSPQANKTLSSDSERSAGERAREENELFIIYFSLWINGY